MSGDIYQVEISNAWIPLDGLGIRTIYEITGLLLFFFGTFVLLFTFWTVIGFIVGCIMTYIGLTLMFFGVTGLIPRDCWDKTFNR